MGRIISSLFFLGILIFLEFYVFYGLKTLFKNGMPRGLKWAYWIVTLFPIFWMIFYISVQGQIGNLRWFNNLVLGMSVTLLITKAFFAIFLLAEDSYRILRFGGGQLMAMSEKGGPAVAWESRRLFVAQLGLALASIPFMSFVYGITRGKYAYTVHKSTLTFPDLPEAFDGFRIVQISDVHAGSFDNITAVERGTEMIQAQKGDIILFTGDLVNNVATEIEPYIHLFKVLNAPFGKFSVLGNHDYATYIRWENEAASIENMARLERNHNAMGFKLMKNESLLLEKNGETMRLAGVENWGRGHFPKEGDLNKTFAETPDGEFTILMSHDPSHWQEHILDFEKHVHLTLSGHTHGMQMGIEVPGIKWSPSKWIYPQWAGLYEKKGKRIYVNRGFGFLGFPGRVGILPEITVLELKKG
jgi:predicted MPP superfamily phosphohydrolase